MKIGTRRRAFSLVEVVLALGVVAFAVTAILGVIPVGLKTSRSSQEQTRAALIAQDIINAMTSQAQAQFNAVKVPLFTGTAPALDLSSSSASPAAQLYADNDGRLSTNSGGAAYSVKILTNSSPAGFDVGYANEVTVSIAWPTAAAPAAQTTRNFVRVVSKY